MFVKTNKESAQQISDFLLQIKAVKLEVSNPFTWASGWKSPIYCDNRKTLSFPEIRTYIKEQFVSLIKAEFGNPDVIAGVATGGIALGALVAQELDIPFVYVRSSEKKHGLENKVEGVIEAGQTVVVVEDLISTGGSSLKVVNALKSLDCKVLGMVAIFTYGFDVAVKSFEDAECKLIALSDYSSLIEKAAELSYIKKADIETLEQWRSMPSNWGV